MFLRRKKNKSGTTSIQIIDKSSGRYRVIESIGTSADKSELDYFWRKGKQRLNEIQGQFSFDLLTPDDEALLSFLNRSEGLAIRVVGPEKILGKIFDQIGFDAIEDEMFRHLVISRLAFPGSKLKTIDYLRRYQGVELQIDRLYRFLDAMRDKYKAVAENIAFEHSKKVLKGDLRVVFYDMTTLYFEASDEDDLRKTGFSKDGKAQHPQILLGLLVGRMGYPIGYEIFEGNTFEGHTLLPVLAAFEQKFGLSRPIVVADAGLLSKANVDTLVGEGYQYILGARIKNESNKIKRQILAHPITAGEWKTIRKDDGSRLIVSYSESRAKKDLHNRKRGLARLEKALSRGKLTKSHINNRGYNKYLQMEGKVSVSIDYEKFEQDGKWDGLKGYLTNCRLRPRTVIETYGHLWQIEKAFRISKTDLRIRPIYHRRRHRIEAHISIAFVAYSVYKELERILYREKAPFSPKRVIELTQTMYALDATLPDSKKPVSVNIANEPDQKRILELFKADL